MTKVGERYYFVAKPSTYFPWFYDIEKADRRVAYQCYGPNEDGRFVCTCPGFAHHAGACKHVAMMDQLQDILARTGDFAGVWYFDQEEERFHRLSERQQRMKAQMQAIDAFVATHPVARRKHWNPGYFAKK